jgi:hypothetical protein
MSKGLVIDQGLIIIGIKHLSNILVRNQMIDFPSLGRSQSTTS